MSALPNVLMTQANPRQASPAQTGLNLTSGDQGRSFEDTLTDKADVNATIKKRPAENLQTESTLPLMDVTLDETNIELITTDIDVDREAFITLVSVDREQDPTVTSELAGKIDGVVIAETTSPSQTFATTQPLELTGGASEIQGQSSVLDVAIPPDVAFPVDEATAPLPMGDLSLTSNRDQALPAIIITSGATPTVDTVTPQTLATQTNGLPQTVATQLGDLGRATEPSIFVPQAVANSGEPDVAQLTNATAQTSPTTAPEVTAAKTETAVLPVAIPSTSGNTAQVDTPTADAEPTDRPRLSDRAAETADYRTLVKSAASPSDLAKIADTPAHPTTLFTSSDAPAPLKSIPVVAALPTLTPLSGMSDRLAATILQTTQAQPTVTMDKLPQTVVAIALSAKSATLQIDPPELGRIQLDYQFDNQGRTVVTLTPESDAARAALMDRIASITAALEQGTNSPVDVKLGDARSFGSEFGQASQDSDRNESDAGPKDGANRAGADNTHTDDLQRFMRAPMGEAERLHILV